MTDTNDEPPKRSGLFKLLVFIIVVGGLSALAYFSFVPLDVNERAFARLPAKLDPDRSVYVFSQRANFIPPVLFDYAIVRLGFGGFTISADDIRPRGLATSDNFAVSPALSVRYYVAGVDGLTVNRRFRDNAGCEVKLRTIVSSAAIRLVAARPLNEFTTPGWSERFRADLLAAVPAPMRKLLHVDIDVTGMEYSAGIANAVGDASIIALDAIVASRQAVADLELRKIAALDDLEKSRIGAEDAETQLAVERILSQSTEHVARQRADAEDGYWAKYTPGEAALARSLTGSKGRTIAGLGYIDALRHVQAPPVNVTATVNLFDPSSFERLFGGGSK